MFAGDVYFLFSKTEK